MAKAARAPKIDERDFVQDPVDGDGTPGSGTDEELLAKPLGPIDEPGGGAPAAAAANGDKPQETKAQRFIRLANRRLNEAVRRIRQLAPLANKSQYEYTGAQIEFMAEAIACAVNEVSRAFEGQRRQQATLTMPE